MEPTDYKKDRENADHKTNAIIFSKNVRAGNRTYFFDVRCTRNQEYYLTVTESKRKFDQNGNYQYQKHKIFIYPEDFDHFTATLKETLSYITENQPTLTLKEKESVREEQEGLALKHKDNKVEENFDEYFNVIESNHFSDIDFDDI